MEAVTPAGRVLRKAQWRATFWPSVDIDPYDPSYFKAMLQHVAAEFGIPMPEITEDPPEDRGGLFTDFSIQGVRAGALLDGRRCSIAVDSEDLRDRIHDLLLRLAA